MKKPVAGTELVTAAQLTKLGWTGVTAKMVASLNSTLRRFNITSKENIRHFIAQTGFESGRGKWKLELGNQSSKKYGEKYKGSGYIQLTWKSNYEDFSDYMGDKRILSEGAKYVAEKYPWEASGYWWRESGMKSVATSSSKATSDKVSKKVNGAGCKTLDKRYEEYKRVAKVI